MIPRLTTVVQKGPAFAYVAGVVEGDGWCSKWSVGLRCKDHDFAVAFALALEDVFGTGFLGTSIWPRLDERGYWVAKTNNRTGRFNQLLGFDPATDDERAAWLRGFFDAEGNAQLTKLKISENAQHRRVSFFGADRCLMDRAAGHLTTLGIQTTTRERSLTRGHKGTRPIFEVRLSNSQQNFRRFADVVGSTIGRKQTTLDRIHSGYPDPQYRSLAGKKGSATRRARRDAGGRY